MYKNIRNIIIKKDAKRYKKFISFLFQDLKKSIHIFKIKMQTEISIK